MAPTVDAVAETAGVGRVTVFRHFSNRSALFDAALAHGLAEAATVLADAELARGPVDEALERAVRALVEVSERYGALTAHVPVGGVDVDERMDRALVPVVQMIERGQAAGTFRTDLPAIWLADVVADLAHAAVRSGGRNPVGDPGDLVLATVRAAFGPPR